MILKNLIKANAYYDSVTLMLISSKVSNLDGVKNAAVMMGTDYNKSLMSSSGLLLEENKTTTANDLVIGIMAETEEAVEVGLKTIEELLENKNKSSNKGEIRAKTMDSAVKAMPNANFTIISVPGKYAKDESMKALERGLHVLLFSDNVSVEEEIELKDKALEKGLLLMGPDCGTAIINGVQLGFANVVNRGNIGMVAAAGTGLQEVSAIVSRLGGGVSQAIGTGGRDLKESVGGRMMLQGLHALAEDEQTKIIVLISKPPAPSVSEKIFAEIKKIKKPVVVCFLGDDLTKIEEMGGISARTLEDAAATAVSLANEGESQKLIFTQNVSEINRIIANETAKLHEQQKYVRGLYSGGTLCYESMLLMEDMLGDIYSNIASNKDYLLKDINRSEQHTCLDMGDDYFTNGRPHPMIDPSQRVERIKKEAADEETAVLLLDVVLGYGSHEDPAGAIVDAIESAKESAAANGRYLSVVASVCGTKDDPQNMEDQIQKLREAGVILMPSNAQAARLASLIAFRKMI